MADLMRAYCRCKCHNPCGYGNCLNPISSYGTLPNPQCSNACLTPSKFYVRFEGLTFSTACHGCVRQVPETASTALCSGVRATDLAFPGRTEFDGAYQLNLFTTRTYWEGRMSDGHTAGGADWAGRIDIRTTQRVGYWYWDLINGEYVARWVQEYGELTAACQPGDIGGSGGCTGTGYTVPTSINTAGSGSGPWQLKLDRTAAGWDLTVYTTIAAIMPGHCPSEGVKLVAFQGTVADADHSSCYKPLVISNALSIGNDCPQPNANGNYAAMTVNLSQGGSAIVTPCAPEVAL